MICPHCHHDQSNYDVCNICGEVLGLTSQQMPTPVVNQYVTVNMPEPKWSQYATSFLEGVMDGLRIIGWCFLAGVVLFALLCVAFQ